MPDEEIMLQLCGAMDSAESDRLFSEIFTRYRNRVVSWCYRMSRNRDTANDLAQEVFLKAYRHRDSFRGESKLSTWLYVITRNHCLTAVKRQRCQPIQMDPSLRRIRDFKAVQPDLAAERAETCRSLLKLMARTLEPLEIQVMTLHYGHDVPLAAITRDLALGNPSGAKAYIVNARRKLQSVLRRRAGRPIQVHPDKVLAGCCR